MSNLEEGKWDEYEDTPCHRCGKRDCYVMLNNKYPLCNDCYYENRDVVCKDREKEGLE